MDRRSVIIKKEYFEEVVEEYTEAIGSVSVPVKSDSKAIPFVWKENHMRFQRVAGSCISSSGTHYTLFILDTSDHFQPRDFKRITNVIGN